MMYRKLRLNGVNKKIYWFSLLITDVSFYLLSFTLILIVGIVFKYEAFKNFYFILIILFTFILRYLLYNFFHFS